MGQDLHLASIGAADTRRIAAAVAEHLRPGDVVVLTGDLGAGKTCFVQGAAPVLGVSERVTSPSFVLRRDYTGDVGVAHLDVYRLDSLREMADLGAEDLFDGQLITFVEWGDAVRPLLPGDHLEVELRRVDDEDTVNDDGDERRLLRICGHGPAWADRMGQLLTRLSPEGER